jgi:hypothetical protein
MFEMREVTAAQGLFGIFCLVYWMIAVDNADMIALALIALGIGAIVALMSYTAYLTRMED